MQNKEAKRKTLDTKILIILLIIVVVIMVGFIIYKYNIDNNKESIENEIVLEGIYKYNENVKYEFKKNGKGAMYDGDNKYEYTYKKDDQKITMDFKDKIIHDATYTYKLENDTLILKGEEGTMGGEYTLKKENK